MSSDKTIVSKTNDRNSRINFSTNFNPPPGYKFVNSSDTSLETLEEVENKDKKISNVGKVDRNNLKNKDHF